MNPWFLLGATLAVAAASGVAFYKGIGHGRAEVQQQWDHEKADMLAKHAENVEKAREKEQNWQQAADSLRQEKDREIKNLNARATALANSLRDRPTRPADESGVPPAASTGQSGCTARELFREDAEVAIRFAREADELRAALKQCYTQYEAVNR